MSKSEKPQKLEVRLSGSGGQGLLTAGLILSQAGALQGLNVTQTQSYGAASRGGSSRSDVIISDEPIFYPEATRFDALVALTQESYDKFNPNLREEGVLIIDTVFVKNYTISSQDIYALPFTQIAMEKLGTSLFTNIIALSFLVKVTGIVTDKYLKEAIKDFKPEFAESNIKAMKLAFKLAEEYDQPAQEKL
ncbi:MAG: 2-oxoacid:acceptor oxidoreductase family protein [Candidatus Cloacimonetes bacterium]|nr:2-oxoacid:acceptor oxidoreductase family protein [Candidatus Cloacimonadota bacterium]